MNQQASRRAALLAATLAAFLTPFMASALNVALPSISRELSMDAIQLSWVATSYLLAAAVFLVPFGRIADIVGRKRIFLYGITVFTLGSLLTGLAVSGVMLLGARVLQGLGSAMIFGTSVAILTSVFPAGERGRVMGINVASVYFGGSVGPLVGGFLTEHLSWRSISLLVVPLGLIVILYTTSQLKGEWAEARGERFDLTGSLIYAAALIAIMYGFSKLPNSLGIGLTLAGILILFAFVRWETRTRAPVLNLRLFAHNRTFTFSSLAALISYSATAAVTFLLSLYLQYIKALTPQQAGLTLIAQPVVQAAVSPLAGWLSDRIEPRIVASVGMALTAVGLVSLAFLVGPTTPLWVTVAQLMLLGLGFGLFSSPNMNAIMSSVQKKFYGVGSGILATMRLLGQMLSMGIAAMLFALYIGHVEITPESYPLFLKSAKAAFAVFGTLCTAGILASLARGKLLESHETDDRDVAEAAALDR